ncbi:MAG: hypothetical protein IIY60_02080 [Clostridia bacterium]|nr:hypothetical protein [Clostridia bacterium]
MKVLLTRQNRIDGKAGDIVEVSPARAAFLFDMKLAVPAPVRERIEVSEKKTAARDTTKKTTAKGKK